MNNIKSNMVKLIRLAANYRGCAMRVIPVWEANTTNTNFTDTLSEFQHFLVDCLSVILNISIPSKRFGKTTQKLLDNPENAYEIFKQYKNIKRRITKCYI